MTPTNLKAIESELKKRGYRKYVQALTSNESWGWFKTFGATGQVKDGIQIEFRVWDYSRFESGQNAYGVDVWASPINTDGRIDLTINWLPIADIEQFEAIAIDFYEFSKRNMKHE